MLWRANTDSPDRLRRRVESLQRRRRLTQAIEIQKKLCDSDRQYFENWDNLGELAELAGREDIVLRARFAQARIEHFSTDEWLQLASRAEERNLTKEHAHALFQAGDTAARSGQLKRASQILARVLEISPKHRHARRISSIVEARLRRQREADEEWARNEAEEISSVTFTYMSDVSTEVSQPLELSNIGESGARELFEEQTLRWSPLDFDESGEESPLAKYIGAAQRWPSVLDESALLFCGASEYVWTTLGGATETISVREGSMLCKQGYPGQLLYVV